MTNPPLLASMSEEDDLTVAFDESGLVPVIAQSVSDGDVLMLAYANAEAIAKTRETGEAHYYSRSRGSIWHKGVTSGHRQTVNEIRVDCDADTVLYLVTQEGGACHTGHRSCFYRTIDGKRVGEQVFDPDEVYG